MKFKQINKNNINLINLIRSIPSKQIIKKKSNNFSKYLFYLVQTIFFQGFQI